MTYTPPTTRATNDVITHTIWNEDVVENFKETLPDKAAAKGNLFVGTGADAMAVLAVGTDGQVLTCASAETSGLSGRRCRAGTRLTRCATGRATWTSTTTGASTSWTSTRRRRTRTGW